MSKILNATKTIYYIVAAIATVISAIIMLVFFRKTKIDDIIETTEDIAETLDEITE